MNKKIANATPLTYNGIKFKSKLEVTCYKVLEEEGFNPLYEEKKYNIFEGFIPHIPFYTKNMFKRKNKNIEVLSNYTVKDNRGISSWVYTPDIYFEHGKYIIHVEVKGFYNDVARYKSKLFRWYLEKMQKDDPNHIYEFWEMHSKTQLLECVKHIKDNND